MKEKHKRTIAKTISWRIFATIITVILVFIFTGRWDISLGIGGVEVITKLIFYYFHERIWNYIIWGKENI